MSSPREFVAALGRSDQPAAIASARAMLAAGLPLGDQWQGIARFAAQAGECSLAIAAMRRFAAAAPEDPLRTLALAATLVEAGRAEEAERTIAPVLARHPAHPALLHFAGTIRIQTGRAAEGEADLDRALAAWPGSGMTWLALANSHRFADADDRLLPRLEAAVAAAADPAQRAPLLYALGKARDDLGDADAAFAAFAEGAAIAHAARAAQHEDSIAAARAIVAAWPALPAVPALPESRAIFVTGLPRSGTTLVEQMLVGHPQVGEGGEVNLLARAAEHLGGPLAPRRSEPAAWQDFAVRYAHLLDERFGPDGRVVDKTLNTSRFAGIVAAGLPGAPLIWLRRDPLDVAWSAFRTYFADGVAWSFDQVALARHMAAEDLLARHWQRLLGDRVLAIVYADLVTDPATWADRIQDHCRLPRDAAVATPERTERAVVTASVAQVRQGVHTRALGSARPYAGHLAPFVRAYADARKTLGLD